MQLQVQQPKPSIVKWNPKKPGLATVGFKSGRVTFIDVQSLRTCSFEYNKAQNDVQEKEEELTVTSIAKYMLDIENEEDKE